jgi:hypothetical protein
MATFLATLLDMSEGNGELVGNGEQGEQGEQVLSNYNNPLC